MSLIRYNWPDMSDFFGDDWFKSRFSQKHWTPAVNVVENEKDFEIEIAAPGLKKDDFTVSVAHGVLSISGKTEKEEEEKGKNYTRKEFSSRSFTKSFTLPEHIDAEGIAAKYDEGVLRLTLLKLKKELPAKKEVSIS